MAKRSLLALPKIGRYDPNIHGEFADSPRFPRGSAVSITFGEFELDSAARLLLKGGEPVHLGPKAFDLLDLLLRHRPQAVSKAQIRDRIWPQTFVSESNLTTLVAELRTALDDPPRRPHLVRTVYGFGYAFCGEASEATSSKARLRTPRPSAGMRFRLYVEDREITLHEGENVLGRADDAVVWIDSAQASRRHARIIVSAGEAVLEDLGSKNGTYLRSQRMRSSLALADGDEIRIGRVLMTFRIFRGLKSTETEAAR